MKLLSSETRTRIAHAILTSGLAASIAYVSLRVIERIRTGPRDPLMTLGEAHTGFYWRWAIATWIGLVTAFVYYIAVRQHERRAREGIALTLLAAPVLALLAWLQP